MSEMSITREMEEKRLKDFQRIAESWDTLPEYARGRLDGIIFATAAFCGGSSEEREAG